MHKGVLHVNDVLTNTRQLLGYYDFMKTYHIEINFYGMTHSTPRDWVKSNKRKLKVSEMKQCLLQKLLQQRQCSKWVYKN